jgi:hypothetical protein
MWVKGTVSAGVKGRADSIQDFPKRYPNFIVEVNFLMATTPIRACVGGRSSLG